MLAIIITIQTRSFWKRNQNHHPGWGEPSSQPTGESFITDDAKRDVLCEMTCPTPEARLHLPKGRR